MLIVQGVLPKEALEEWGWRVPFAVGGLLAIVVFWLRTGIAESGAYLKAAQKTAGKPTRRSGTLQLIRAHPREVGAIFALTAAGSLAFYAYTTYMPKFLVNTAGFAKDTATQLMAVALVTYMLLQPLIGWISDHVGRKRTIAVGLGLGGLATYPVMTAIAGAHTAGVALGLILILLVLHSGYAAVNAALKAELFPTAVRALGVALPYAIANAIFGGTAEYVAGWLKKAGHESLFYIYVGALMLIAAAVAARLRDTNKTSLIED